MVDHSPPIKLKQNPWKEDLPSRLHGQISNSPQFFRINIFEAVNFLDFLNHGVFWIISPTYPWIMDLWKLFHSCLLESRLYGIDFTHWFSVSPCIPNFWHVFLSEFYGNEPWHSTYYIISNINLLLNIDVESTIKM